MLVDSHCHLDRLDLVNREGGLEGVIADAQQRGVSHLLTVAISKIRLSCMITGLKS